jgi:hypothetical protein
MVGGVAPSPLAKPVEDLNGAGVRRMSPALFSAVTPPSALAAAAPSSRRLVTGAGTELLAFSPFAQQPDSAPAPASPAPYSAGRPLAAQPAPSYGQKHLATPNGALAAPLMRGPATPGVPSYAPPLGARFTGSNMARVDVPQFPAQPVPPSGPPISSQAALGAAPLVPAPAPKKGSRAGLVIVLLVLVLGGGAGGVWVAANRFGLSFDDLGATKEPATSP